MEITSDVPLADWAASIAYPGLIVSCFIAYHRHNKLGWAQLMRCTQVTTMKSLIWTMLLLLMLLYLFAVLFTQAAHTHMVDKTDASFDFEKLEDRNHQSWEAKAHFLKCSCPHWLTHAMPRMQGDTAHTLTLKASYGYVGHQG